MRKEAGYTTELWTRNGIKFIEQNKGRPFFLFLAYNGPYNLGKLMRNPPRNLRASHYEDKHFLSFPVDAMHPWQAANKGFHNTQTAMERCAALAKRLDDFFATYADPQYNIWKGGRSKAKLHTR